jgi:hypothetical protein
MIDPKDLKEVKRWYNGYVFGKNTVVFNPWSIISFLRLKERRRTKRIQKKYRDSIC